MDKLSGPMTFNKDTWTDNGPNWVFIGDEPCVVHVVDGEVVRITSVSIGIDKANGVDESASRNPDG